MHRGEAEKLQVARGKVGAIVYVYQITLIRTVFTNKENEIYTESDFIVRTLVYFQSGRLHCF